MGIQYFYFDGAKTHLASQVFKEDLQTVLGLARLADDGGGSTHGESQAFSVLVHSGVGSERPVDASYMFVLPAATTVFAAPVTVASDEAPDWALASALTLVASFTVDADNAASVAVVALWSFVSENRSDEAATLLLSTAVASLAET